MQCHLIRRTPGRYIRSLHFTCLYVLNFLPRSTLYSTSNKTKPLCMLLTLVLRAIYMSPWSTRVIATDIEVLCSRLRLCEPSFRNNRTGHHVYTSAARNLAVIRTTSWRAPYSSNSRMSTRFAIVQRNQSEDKRTLDEEQLPIPKLEKSQVLVKVEKAALNPTDGWCPTEARQT